MALSRSRRKTKVVDYSSYENIESASSDDDFSNSEPPSKKKRERKIKKKQNQSEEKNSNTLILSDDDGKKIPSERLSVEERKFQRDLETALELSVTPKSFQGFGIENTSEKSEEGEEDSSLKKCVVTVELHNVSKNLEKESTEPSDSSHTHAKCISSPEKVSHLEEANAVTSHKQPESDVSKSPSVQENPISSTSDGLATKRQKKKVNFIEDDSDSWSDENKEKRTDSDSGESDFSPSPLKKKEKKMKPTKRRKNKKSEEKSISKRSPLKDKQISSATQNEQDTYAKSLVHSVPLCKSNSSNSVTKTSIMPVTEKSTHAKSNFKSPIISTASVVSTSRNLHSPSRIGLRLGLSRKVLAKPLHPNASVK